jgi:hypothetical protein
MNEPLLEARASAVALQEPASRGEGDRHPQRDGDRQRHQETDVELPGASQLHRGASILAVLSVGAVQVVWVVVLAYVAYWLVTHFPI